MRSRVVLLVSLIVFASGCTAQKPASTAGWKRYESAELGVSATFPCQPEKTTALPAMNGDPNVVSLACEADGLRFLITRRNHLNPYTDDMPREIFDSDRKLFKGIFGKPDEFSESDDCQTDHPCHIYNIAVKDMRVRSQIVVTRAATIEAMVGTVPRESGGVSKESLASFDETFKEFIGALEVRR